MESGTKVGDPIEVEAMSRVFQHASGKPLIIGSIKTNIGHSEAASGLSSVIKIALAFEKGVIPPTIGIAELNPDLELQSRNIEVARDYVSWPKGRVRAGINSFGYGGANAHAILEPANSHVPVQYMRPTVASNPTTSQILISTSAHKKEALLAQVDRLSAYVLDKDSLIDAAWTLARRRSRLARRGYLIADLAHLDRTFVQSNLKTLEGLPGTALPIAFAFTGQGAQWPKMGSSLIKEYPFYRLSIEYLDSVLAQLPQPPDWTLLDLLLNEGDPKETSQAHISQPLCTATQIALVQLLEHWEVVPEAVVGHSSGSDRQRDAVL